jgi:hypothetical protein
MALHTLHQGENRSDLSGMTGAACNAKPADIQQHH